MKHLLKVCVFLLFATMFFFCSCKKNPETPPRPAVPETTIVLDDEIWSNSFMEMDSSSFTLNFNDLMSSDIVPGNYIVSTAGNGLLREVNTVQKTDEGYRVTTSFAALTDVINEGSGEFNETLSELNIKTRDLAQGVKVNSSAKGDLNYNIDIYFGENQEYHLYGDFQLGADVDGHVELGEDPTVVNSFDISYNVAQNLNLTLDILPEALSYSTEVSLGNVTFNPIFVLVAGVPVMLVPELSFYAGMEAILYDDLSVNASQSLNYTVGLEYENGVWNSFENHSAGFDYNPPDLDGNAEARVYIKPKFSIKIYNVLSPYLYAEIFGRIEADLSGDPWWDLYSGVDLGIGVEAAVLGYQIVNYYTNPPLIRFETLIASATEPPGEAPVAEFSGLPQTGPAPLEVIFSDLSTNEPASWSWSFGDGNLSTEKDPINTYDQPGSYDVQLIVFNQYGADTLFREAFIVVTGTDDPPDAAMDASPKIGNAPLEVSFTDLSANNPDSWSWDFGDGHGSNNQNPVHTYDDPGIYNISLTVSNEFGSDNIIMEQYITVLEGGGGNTGEPCPGTPTVTDIDGNTYETVQIGIQCWMAENISTTHYPNGDMIPHMADSTQWDELLDSNTADAYCFYENYIYSEYGAIYTYAAAIGDNWERDNTDGQGICPDGWHLPDNDEWSVMVEYLIANGYNWDGSASGDKTAKSLAYNSGWTESEETGDVGNNQYSNNSTNFSALPGGRRSNAGSVFFGAEQLGYWWTATATNENYANYRGIYYSNDFVVNNSINKAFGFSVRCVKN